MASESIVSGMGRAVARPAVRRIGLGDVGDALRRGFADFRANPTHLVFLSLIYPIAGLLFGRIASGYNAVPLLYPLIGGFALIGPIAAVGLYDFSRRRERGESVSWRNAFDILQSPRIGAIAVLAGMLVGLFALWLLAAQLIYNATLNGIGNESLPDLVRATLYTPAGHTLLVVGTLVGFVFAVVALTIGVISVPLLVDRDIATTPGEEAAVAVETSTRAVLLNIGPMIAWGLVVVAGLAIGVVTLLVGFAVIMPVLGHATWHLYRKMVV